MSWCSHFATTITILDVRGCSASIGDVELDMDMDVDVDVDVTVVFIVVISNSN